MPFDVRRLGSISERRLSKPKRMAVLSRATSVTTPRSGKRAFRARIARWAALAAGLVVGTITAYSVTTVSCSATLTASTVHVGPAV